MLDGRIDYTLRLHDVHLIVVDGIGNVMMIASGNFDVPMVFAGLFILAGLGISLYAISSFVEQRMTGWSQRKSEMAMA